MTVVTAEETWYASIAEGAVRALVYGQGENARQIIPADMFANGYYLPRSNALVTVSGDENVTLDAFDLENGTRTASVRVEGFSCPWCITEDDAGFVWMLTSDAETGKTAIHRWDSNLSAVSDATVYSGARYTLKNPDVEGLALCQEMAEEIGDKYGVQILVGEAAVAEEPWDYSMEAEYSVPVIRWYLQELDEVLSWYPAEFFAKTAEVGDGEILKICLVRSITGTPVSGRMSPADGVQFWTEDGGYLAVAVGGEFMKNFCHEMCHAMETRVYAKSNLFDDWDWLNPEGFAYDFDYIANETRDGSAYLQEQTRAFIDTYSMSFPKEDRARVMEYAMMEGNESYFQSEVMQEKLLMLCKAIREAFGWKKSEEVFRWEQYLNEPIAYQKKK